MNQNNFVIEETTGGAQPSHNQGYQMAAINNKQNHQNYDHPPSGHLGGAGNINNDPFRPPMDPTPLVGYNFGQPGIGTLNPVKTETGGNSINQNTTFNNNPNTTGTRQISGNQNNYNPQYGANNNAAAGANNNNKSYNPSSGNTAYNPNGFSYN